MTELALDTSVAVPLLVTSHVAHRAVSAALGERAAALAGHALHETYAVLTRLPGDARVAPADALRLLAERFEKAAVLDARSVRSAPAVLAAAGVVGGATYDGWWPSPPGRRASRSPPAIDGRRAPTVCWTCRSRCSAEIGGSATGGVMANRGDARDRRSRRALKVSQLAARSLALCDMRTLYLRNVPDEVGERLERLAAREGLSLSAFATRELAAIARRADNPALLAQLPDVGVDAGAVVAAVEAGRTAR